jgi:hypothetical protein
VYRKQNIRKHINFIGTGFVTIMKKYREQRGMENSGKNNYEPWMPLQV